MSKRDIALVVFVVVMAVNVLGLLFDLWLERNGIPTITARVRANGWLGVPIMAWQAVGFAGLAWHFYGE